MHQMGSIAKLDPNDIFKYYESASLFDLEGFSILIFWFVYVQWILMIKCAQRVYCLIYF